MARGGLRQGLSWMGHQERGDCGGFSPKMLWCCWNLLTVTRRPSLLLEGIFRVVVQVLCLTDILVAHFCSAPCSPWAPRQVSGGGRVQAIEIQLAGHGPPPRCSLQPSEGTCSIAATLTRQLQLPAIRRY